MRWLLLAAAMLLVACTRPTDTGVQALPPSPVQSNAGTQSEQELDWLQMLPSDELAALERGEGPEVQHNGNRRMAQFGTFRTVDAVLDRAVRLPGYVVPLANAADGRLVEFLFVPYYGACIHVPPPPGNQIVYVKPAKPVENVEIWNPYWIEGTMRIRDAKNDVASASYSFEADDVRPYL